VPGWREARLHSAAEISGHLLAVRSAHGGLLLQAAEAFFLGCTGAAEQLFQYRGRSM